MLYLLLALFTAAIVAVDQLTKYLAAANLVGKTVTLIPGWLQLHYITNDGMALSLLRGARWLFVVMTAVYLAAVIYVLVKKWFKKTPELWCIAAITGGAIGNFIDRISTGLVIDMICIPWFSTFNVADLFITFGAIILVLYIFIKDKEFLSDGPLFRAGRRHLFGTAHQPMRLPPQHGAAELREQRLAVPFRRDALRYGLESSRLPLHHG